MEMNRALLTQEQAKAIEYIKRNGDSFGWVLDGHAHGPNAWLNSYNSLNGMDIDTLAKALYNGYEVEDKETEDNPTLTELIESWAIARNLHTADPIKQALKLGEEYGELCQGLAKGRMDDTKDAIGDMVVVLAILSMQLGTTLDDCAELAYQEIKDRKGKMVNGVFVKEADL